MSLVWRKIQRSNKKAAKFRFSAQFQELSIQCSKKWQPSKVSVAWVHRRRRYFTKEHKWEPTITDPYKGLILWPNSNPEFLEITTTLYRDSRPDSSFDDKEWTFIVEETTNRGRRKPIAGVNLNMRLFVNEIPGTQTELKLKLKPLCEHLVGCQLQLVLTCTIIKEGDANDDDMRSVASVMSVQLPNHDIGILADVEDEFGSGNSFGSGSGDSPQRYSSNNMSLKFSEVATKIEALTEIKDEIQGGRQRSSMNSRATPVTNSQSFSRNSTEFRKNERNSGSQMPATSSTKPLDVSQTSFNDSGIADDVIKTDAARKSDTGTTSQDLLSWCQTVTKKYKRVKITDFSSSWRNGLAFCALIHNFRPELIDFDSLNSANIRENCTLAFEAALTMGIPKLIDPSDMVIMAIPDKIAIMTYVYMLRSYLTGQPMPEQHHNSNHLHQYSKSHHSSTDENQENFNRNDDLLTTNNTADSSVIFRSDKIEQVSTIVHHESRKSGRDSSTPKSKIKSRKSGSGTSSERSSHTGSPVNENLSLTLSTENIQKPVLMTRNQLMNPFDSDDESKHAEKSNAQAPPLADQIISDHTDNVNLVKSPIDTVVEIQSKSAIINSTSRVVSPTSAPPTSKQEEYKRKTRELLEQYKIDREKTPDQDDERRRELKERARRLIEEATSGQTIQQQKVVKISETLNFNNSKTTNNNKDSKYTSDDQPVILKTQSAPATRNVTPDSKNLSLNKNSPTSTPISFYQFGEKKRAPPTSVMITKESLLNETGRSRRAYPQVYNKTEAVSTSSAGVNYSAMDRFKRFGSMRGQELAQSINILSNRLSPTVRSASEPKEINYRQSTRQISVERELSPISAQSFLENEGRSRGQLMAEMEDVANKTKELNRKATEVEKRWRQVMQDASGSEEEQKLMNEYLALLNERNMLTRREMHLSLLENISDQENRFQMVQKELGELIQIEDSEKTEDHKLQIDRLMEELINIVNKRDELVQQLLAHEQGTEEDEELANDVMANSNLLPAEDKEACTIQ